MVSVLAADLGGTNARLALFRDGVMAAGPQRFRNDDFSDFAALAAAFLAQAGMKTDAVCVAAAGPVQGGRARLTNRDWEIEESALAAGLGAGRGIVMNDLAAQALGLHRLGPEGLRDLAPAQDPDSNGQEVAMGFGTGMNLCLAKRLPDGRHVAMAQEWGHASLPAGVLEQAPPALDLSRAATVEDWFSGRGVAALHALRTGARMPGEAVVEAADSGNAEAEETLRIFARMAGALCRDVALQLMPYDGLCLAGGAARGALQPRFAAEFQAVYRAHPRMAHILARVPVRVVMDDNAALLGCLAAAEEALGVH